MKGNSALDGMLDICAKNLVQCKRVPKLPTRPIDNTPLITNFAKWSGKKKRLYADNASQLKHKVGYFNLQNNLFANLLSSPMRSDKMTKLKIPKDMLLQLKLIPIDEIREGEDQDTPRCLFRLAPILDSYRITQSSYVTNSFRVLNSNHLSLRKALPMSVRGSTIRSIDNSEIRVEAGQILDEYKSQLVAAVKSGIVNLQATIEMNTPVVLESGDVLLTYNETKPMSIEVRKLSENSEMKIIVFNLKCTKNDELDKLLNGARKNSNEGIILKSSKDKRLIGYISKLLAFSH